MTVNEYFEANPGPLRKYIECADGFKLSVQASFTHYCSPRINNAPSYSSVEVGFPSQEDVDLMPYAEDSTKPTQTVYGFVPVEVVDAVIAKHGGFKQ